MGFFTGVYKREGPYDVFVNLSDIPSLAVTEVSVENYHFIKTLLLTL